ncbi:DUF378 domain-containing protein [Candidatus Uhrbacteria bacterium]|nr:DUF378 domain-containing protein [Candidatus Uhrbacteria bacterium]
MKSNSLTKVAWWLVIVGAVNWGLIGLFDWNLVNAIFDTLPLAERIVYILVGLGALHMLFEKTKK